MARVIDRNEVRTLIQGEGAQLVEVLPRNEYEAEHIAGAINIPLQQLDPQRATQLDRSRPIVVYCNDFT
jgi:rhodanese-related sulfurtransferase